MIMNTEEKVDKLCIVVPCYNEEQMLDLTVSTLTAKISELITHNKIEQSSKVLFVDDGSKDSTWEIIERYSKEKECVGGIKLSRNEGHQNALMAGMEIAEKEYDVIITIDADLQDDVSAIDCMINKYYGGCDIVYGVRSTRKTDTFFKRITAECFYKITNFLGGELIYNHADFRLMSKRAVQALLKFGEVNLFLRGIIPMLGFATDVVYYDRQQRVAGETKYPLEKMIRFAVEGITSLSVKPIQLITKLGIIMVIISISMLIWMVVQHFLGKTIVGWTSMLCSIWFIGGVIVFSIGVVGEYVGKIYLESKHRPRYFIEKTIL